jgi:hypothetical protein
MDRSPIPQLQKNIFDRVTTWNDHGQGEIYTKLNTPRKGLYKESRSLFGRENGFKL